MKIDWSRELSTCAQYLLISFVAATAALLYQAADDFDRANILNDGIISDFAYSEVLKGAGMFYLWLLGAFLALSLLRLLILFALSRTQVEIP